MNFLSILCTWKTGVGQAVGFVVIVGVIEFEIVLLDHFCPKAQADRKWSCEWTSIYPSSFIGNPASHVKRQTCKRIKKYLSVVRGRRETARIIGT